MSIRLTLPMPPTVNNLYANTTRGRVKSLAGKRFALEVALICAQAHIEPYPRGVEVATVYRFYMARRSDLSNRVKALEDALKGWAWVDDIQIAQTTMERFSDTANPRVEVEIRET